MPDLAAERMYSSFYLLQTASWIWFKIAMVGDVMKDSGS